MEEILSQPAVQTRLADTKASEEIRALATFFDMLKKDPDRAYYGYNVRVVDGDELIGSRNQCKESIEKCARGEGGGCAR